MENLAYRPDESVEQDCLKLLLQEDKDQNWDKILKEGKMVEPSNVDQAEHVVEAMDRTARRFTEVVAPA